MLYLIEILHQTTTNRPHVKRFRRCILSKFYIKPQRGGCFFWWLPCCILSKFYIKPQQNFQSFNVSQVVSYRNSTSNHNIIPCCSLICRVVSYRNSTSNHNRHRTISHSAIVVSYRNSTSNHNTVYGWPQFCCVVSYRNSTSNHNYTGCICRLHPVVSYRNSTSNHNVWLSKATHKRLYLIEILHQTTTRPQLL